PALRSRRAWPGRFAVLSASRRRSQRPAQLAASGSAGGGKDQAERCATAAARIEDHVAAHRPGELAGDREAEAGAADGVGGVEAVEDPISRSRIDPGTVVGDGQAGFAGGARWADLDLRSRRRVLERVVDENTQ